MSERPGSIHIAYVCCDADCQDAVHQGDEATVPLVAPGPVNVTQDEVERDPTGQAQERKNHKQCHLLFYRQNKQEKLLKPTYISFKNMPFSSHFESHYTERDKCIFRHILLCNIPYSRKRQHSRPKTWTVQSFVSNQQLAFA